MMTPEFGLNPSISMSNWLSVCSRSSFPEVKPAPRTERIEFVDEDDARRFGLRLFEQIPYAGRPHADEHLDKRSAADRIERHARFARDGLCKQRFARARRTHDQHTLRDLAAKPAIAFCIAQKGDDLPEFGFGFIDPGDVVEGNARFVLHEDMRIAATHLRVLLQSARAPPQQIPHEK